MAYSNYAASPGVYVNEIDLSDRVISSGTTIAAIVGASAKGPVNERSLITSTQEFINVFGHPNPKISMMHYSALSFLEESGTLYVTRVVGDNTLTAGAYLTVDDPNATTPILRLSNFDDGTSTPKGIVDPIKNLGFLADDPAINNTLLYICAANPGSWNNRLAIQIRPSNSIGIAVGDGHDSYDFYIDVYLDYTGPRNHPVESFLVNRENKVDGFGNQLFVEDVINRKSNYIRVKNNPFCKKIKILKNAFEFLDGATDGNLPSNFDIMAGWDLYTDPETIDIGLLINGGYTSPEVQIKMDELAQLRKDCIALLDIPSNMQQTADAITYRKEILNLDSSYSALYTPDVKIKDPYNDIELFVPLSGYAAAICARTDNNTYLWNAPAGLNNGQLRVIELRHIYNLPARDALDAANINMVRVFPGMGRAMWAQNTMQSKASALSNINVRRLLNYMEKRIANSSLYSVFETNNYLLRLRLVTMIEAFLSPIKANGGLLDFMVVCDESNNPVSAVASGNLILDVYVDPTLPAKRIHLNATITKTGAIFRETTVNTTASGLKI